ncbi:hypothetical protein C0581_00905 [Candidatus Parcubacteria bacterium]|nr:MAG: hypothetical protein C0581_00905 [Candidatus Parcubacteria bacterium]
MEKIGHYQNKSSFTQRRKKLRSYSTKAEIILWQRLKNKQLGVKFRRQFNIGFWIVDFYCHELKLIIEVDGWIHSETKEKITHDIMRQKILEKEGYVVMRFSNDKVLNNTDLVVLNISKLVEEMKN